MNDNIQPVFLLAATAWWPLSARLAGELVRHGCSVEALCPPGHPLRHVKGVGRCHIYSRAKSLRTLRQAITATSWTLIIPCDDGVVRQMHQLHEERPELRTLIARSLGAAASFGIVDSREGLYKVAQELNIRVPRTKRAERREDLRAWFERIGDIVVLKQDGTYGGNGVRVASSLAVAAKELTRMLRPMPWTLTAKRLLVDRDPLTLWNKRHDQPRVTLQEFVPGRPANLMMACWQGKVLGAVMVEVLWSQGTTGAAMTVRLINHHEMAQAACKLAKRLELSGFHGLDFILEAGTGAAYLIELNPRCTQLGHLPIAGQGSLASLLCRRLGAPSPVGPSPANTAGLTHGDTIAFFPRAFTFDPIGNLRAGYQDMPREDPALVRELLKEDWPDRRWPARLYHRIRPRTPLEPIAFDEAGPLDGSQG